MPAKVKAPHHRGTYHVESAKIRAAAYAQPWTTCWRCGQTLAQIRARKPRAKWTAGHINDGEVGGVLLPECSPCNASAGAKLGNARRNPKRPQPRLVTNLTLR